MTGNIYLDLTNEFNANGLRAILSSGQAVVLHRLALASKDGDWIVREDGESLDWILEVLEGHGAVYRLGAPLDARWMRGGWSAHFEFMHQNNRIRCDFVSRPPRLGADDLADLWREQENGGCEFSVPTIDARRLADLKKTDRERDYAFIGELARKMGLRDQFLQSRSALDLLELASLHPEMVGELSQKRSLLQLLLGPDVGRRTLQLALFEEQFDLMETNEKRLAAYDRAAQNWQRSWLPIQKKIRGLPLREAHRIVIESAASLLPENAHGFS